ncbi:amino acid permease [Haloarchaeobius baliensis]|uniref:amino acid permease n=1 Tax=Haloarchaeobius baliensis TaxID=1670458 RepID=UPI003F88408E
MVERTRSLGFRVAFAMGLGTMIAAGIFSLSGSAVYAIGSSAVIAFVIAAFVAGVTAASYSEFASIYSENGGGYLFSSRTFENETLMFAVGASLFFGYTGTTAFYLATMSEWFQLFIIPDAWPVPTGTVGILTALLLGYLNAQGTEESGSVQVLITAAKVAVLLVFIAGAIAYAGISNAAIEFSQSFQYEPVGIVSTAGTAFITFFGFSAIAASAGEIIEPRKTVPKAIAASMLTVTVLYIFVIVALVNTPPADAQILTQGETAMGAIAQVFLGPLGQWLIVAGAVFSMISASNASILAGSGIGYLMGKQGQAPRRFSRIHPETETPFWSVTAVTGTIVVLITVFIAVLGHGSPVPLGLHGLTNFATFNLLAPLAVVNAALILSRRKFPDIDRPFSVPAGAVLPVVGIVANIVLIVFIAYKGLAIAPPSAPEAYIVQLPLGEPVYVGPEAGGVVAGLLVVGVFVVAYRVWGGQPDVDELVRDVGAPEQVGTRAESAEAEGKYTVLVPVALLPNADRFGRIAARIARLSDPDPHVKFLTVTEVPEQTPTDAVEDVASKRADRLASVVDEAGLDVDYSVDAHVCQDLAFDILQTARQHRVDRILMGYPEEHRTVAEEVEHNAPCDTIFLSGLGDESDLDTVTVGVGGGPHHEAMLSLAAALGEAGADIHVVNVRPGAEGTAESFDTTLESLPDDIDTQLHKVTSSDVASALVDAAAAHGGVLLIGASRDRQLRRWVFGSTPDRVVDLAAARDVPVAVFASQTGFADRLEEYSFPLYRFARNWLGGDDRPDGDRSVDTGQSAD